MKKFFALTLAVAMVLSLASVAMADVNSSLNDKNADVNKMDGVASDSAWYYNSTSKGMDKVTSVEFGKTVYFMLTQVTGGNAAQVTDSKAVAGLKLTPEWTEGGEYVKSVEFAKKAGAYWVAVNTTGSSLDGKTLVGEIYIKGTSGTGDLKGKINGHFDVDLPIEYKAGTVGTATTDTVVPEADGKKVYQFKDVNDDEHTIDFGGVADVFVDVENEKKILLDVSVDSIDAIDEAYPDANIDYVTMTGKFKKTAEVYLYAEEGSYLYAVEDGELVEMKAEYDEWEEAFIFKTKNLGAYAISDAELELVAAVETAPANPSTGAAA